LLKNRKKIKNPLKINQKLKNALKFRKQIQKSIENSYCQFLIGSLGSVTVQVLSLIQTIFKLLILIIHHINY